MVTFTMADFSFLCAKCNKRVPTNQVRMLGDGKYMCFDCAGFAPNRESEGPRISADRANREEIVDRVRYQCEKCRYEFWLRKTGPKKCPYCNGERIEEKRGAAQKMLDMHLPMRDEE